MTKALLVWFAVVAIGCSNSSSENTTPSGPQQPLAIQNPIIGEWVYTMPGTNNATGSGIILSLDADKRMRMEIVYFNKGRQASKFFARKYTGLYRENLDVIEFVYQYTTCNDLASEKFKLMFQDGKLVLLSTDRQKTFSFVRRIAGNYDPNFDIQFIEDTGCNQMFTKTMPQSKRSVASAQRASLFNVFD